MTQEPQANESEDFPFLKLPCFAKEEMLGLLKLCEILDMSTFSKKTAQVIRNSSHFLPAFSLDVRFESCTSLVINVEGHAFHFEDISFYNHSQFESRNFGGVDVLVEGREMSGESKTNVVCPTGKMEIFTDAVIRHLLFIFVNCYVESIDISLRGANLTFAKEELSAINKTRKLEVNGGGAGNRYVLPKMKVTDVYWNFCSQYSEGPAEQDIACSELIIVIDSSSLPVGLLMNTNCSCILLKRSSYNAEDLVNFLKKWENSTGNEMKNIKSVVIKTSLPIGNLDLSKLNLIEGEIPFTIERSDGTRGCITQQSPNSFRFEVSSNENETDEEEDEGNSLLFQAAIPSTVAAPDTSQDLRQYKLKPSDNQIFEISHEALKFSRVLSDLVAMFCTQDKKDSEPVPIDHIRGNILKLIVDWSERQKNKPIPGPGFCHLSKFEKKLLDIPKRELFDLICAADYLNHQPLMRISCKKAVALIKGKLPEEIRAIYCIPTDEEDEAAERAAARAREHAAGNKSGEGSSAA